MSIDEEYSNSYSSVNSRCNQSAYYICYMGSFGDRVRERRQKLELTQEQLAEKAGVAQETIANIEGGRNKGSKHVATLANVLRCRPLWLEKGRGSADATNLEPAVPDMFPVPLIDFVAAGKPRIVADPTPTYGAHEILWTDLKVSDGTFALTLTGDSMEPDFKSGDKVIIDPAVLPRPGDCVVAKVVSDEEVTFKKYRPRGVDDVGRPVYELVPLNEDYETIRSDRTPCNIIGTMVEHRRFRRR